METAYGAEDNPDARLLAGFTKLIERYVEVTSAEKTAPNSMRFIAAMDVIFDEMVKEEP
jgi:hypothetical protein